MRVVADHADRDTTRPQHRRTASTVFAWALWTFAVASTPILVGLTHASKVPIIPVLAGTIFEISFATVGALIAARFPKNPIGWLFLAMGLAYSASAISNVWANYALVWHPGALPGADYAVWVQNWAILAALAPIVPALLLFPDGRPATRRWAPALPAAAIGIVLVLLSFSFAPRLLDNGSFPNTPNPLAIGLLAGLTEALRDIGLALVALTLVAAIGSSIMRFRRAEGIERQQLTWLAWSSSVLPIEVGLLTIVDLPAVVANPTLQAMTKAAIVLALVIVPIAVGVAILRYHLYDIDRLINRTLVYATLTTLLGAGYLVGVLLLQRLLDPLTGSSNLAVAGTTISVAALARPARRRIQFFVDRRFYRRKYDAERTLQSFGLTARDTADLNQLTGELTRIVAVTMQPEHVSIWLRFAAAEEVQS